jgi:hypothetical protein
MIFSQPKANPSSAHAKLYGSGKLSVPLMMACPNSLGQVTNRSKNEVIVWMKGKHASKG